MPAKWTRSVTVVLVVLVAAVLSLGLTGGAGAPSGGASVGWYWEEICSMAPDGYIYIRDEEGNVISEVVSYQEVCLSYKRWYDVLSFVACTVVQGGAPCGLIVTG